MRALTPSEMRELQVGLLNIVDRFCREHDIRYFLHAGTLLGAVRHKGFIPWDDDVDLLMFRHDYERFCREFAGIGGYASLHSMSTRTGYGLAYAKVADDRTLIVGGSPLADPIGVNIDVFPADGWPDGLLATWLHRKRLAVPHGLAAVRANAYNPDRGLIKSLVIKALQPVIRRFWSASAIAERISHAARSYESRHSSYVGVTVFNRLQRVEAAAYADTAALEFEGHKYPAPRDSHRVLQLHYGDYMTPPPENERREGWHAAGAHWLEEATD